MGVIALGKFTSGLTNIWDFINPAAKDTNPSRNEISEPQQAIRDPGTEQLETKYNDFSNSSILAFATLLNENGYALKVEDTWEGHVETVRNASFVEFRDALKNRHDIVHLSAGFDEKKVWFSKQTATTEQFRDMFVATGGTKLLVLDGCGSFAIGKVLEDAGLDYLVVALPRATSPQVFFDSFYSHLHSGVEPAESFKRSLAEVSVRHRDASGEYFFTDYKSHR